LLIPWPASAQWVTVDFQDPAPFSLTSAGGTDDLYVMGNAGTCANGINWNYSRVAPGPNNGGWNNRGFVRWTWCNYAVSRTEIGASGWSGTTSGFRPSGGWPNTFFGRFRIYIERPIRAASGGDLRRQFKFFMWHRGVWDGDQRVIGFLEGGSNCGGTDSTSVCFTLQRNINHGSDTATVQLPVGQWHHLQFSWRHGVVGTSFVKVWHNNNIELTPSAQDLTLNGSPTLPGGTEWVKDNEGYDQPFHFGNSANSGTQLADDFVVRLMDLELDSRFDSTWASGSSGGTTAPTAPQNLRILP
jgi:hypothetical protein